MDPVFRPMSLDDIEQVYEIEQESFTTPWTPETFYHELVHNDFAHYLIMEMDGQVIGYGGMWAILDEAHITNIALRKAYRGQKLGEKLMARLMQDAEQLGLRRMTLEVRVSNTIAQRLYQKMGFYSVGTRKQYYSDNKEDALIMWVDLDQTGKRTDDETETSSYFSYRNEL